MSGTLSLPTTGTFSGLTEQGYINTALAALATLNQGASAPTTAGTGLASLAGLIWHDTANALLKIRDQADTVWITVGKFDETAKAWIPYTDGPEQNIASGATTDLGSKVEQVLSVTGTTTITSFGSSANANSPIYFLRFTGALTITHNASSLICLGGANIPTAAGDVAIMKYEGSGNWRMLAYWPAGFTPVQPYFDATYAGGAIALSTGVNTKINLDTVNFDNRSWWDAVNHRYTPKVAGKYKVTWCCVLGDSVSFACVSAVADIFKNGANAFGNGHSWNGSNNLAAQNSVSVSAVITMNGSTDYLEPYVQVGATSPQFFGGSVCRFIVDYEGP